MLWDARRQYRRVRVGRDHVASFGVGGHYAEQVALVDLSAGGCFLLLPKTFSGRVREGAILVDFTLDHDALPALPVSGRVLRLVPDPPGAPGHIGLGVIFMSTSPRFTEWIDAYVEEVHAGIRSA